MLAIARVTARESDLPPVRLTVGPAADLRALLDYRDDLVIEERTALINRVHAELSGLSPGCPGDARGPPGNPADLCRRRLERVLAIDAEAAALKRQINVLVADSGSTLTQMHGVGPVVAARPLAEVVDIAATQPGHLALSART